MSAWVILQVGEVTFEPMGIPADFMRALIVLVLAGFPTTFVLAWLIETGPRGFIFDLPLWPREDSKRVRSHRSDMALVGGVSVMLAFGIYSALQMLEIEPAPEPVAEVSTRNSIAVLAFDNFDGQAETDYFSSGLAEEILNLLAGIRELDVAARTSSFQFRGERIDVREVAKTLDVRNVLEGSVQRIGNRVRVNSQLINGASGFQEWRQTYDRELADVFAIQREIAKAVTDELKIALSMESVARMQSDPTASLDAYLFYLQGTEKLRSSHDESVMQAAKQLFDQALAIDPIFSRAHAGRCEVLLRLYEIGNEIKQFELAETACTQAASLDAGLNAEIHVALARLYRFRNWNDQADEQLKKAINLAPTYVDAYIELGELRMAQGNRDEAEANFLRAVDLKRNYWKAHEALASFYYRTERYQEAVQAYSMVTRLAPDMASAFASAGAAYWMLGDVERSRTAWDRSLELKPSRQAYTNLGLRYYYAGRFADAVSMQQNALKLAPDDHRVWGRLAESYRFVGDKSRESLAAYKKAADLAEANLEINGSDWATRGLLGIYYVYSERLELGARTVDQAVEASERNAEAFYYQALVRIKLGDTEGAIDVLAEALAKDPQYRQFLLSDPDFIELQALPRFKAIFNEGISVRREPS